ncbi:FG-GAP-like repeat-containing protein [Streptomyces sp. NPDC057638]|uniref:FG-GAP-like repeat-containing protein n=1 Tax=Streptomyces sp. NPDC057638 TaxID=3346190 RepID=UPI00368945F2
MHKRTLATAIAVASATLLAGLAPAAVAAPDKPGSGTTKPAKAASDFNGDGYGDLVVQASVSRNEGIHRAGAVSVVYGSAPGATATKTVAISQDTPGIPGASEEHDRFGHDSATADYDGDGYADLAISADGEDMTIGGGYRRNAGQITIVWGGKHGLTKHGATTVKQTAPRGLDWRRGASLAAGDFNGDGRADLASSDHSDGRGGEVLYGPISRTGKPKSIINLGIKDRDRSDFIDLSEGDVTGDGISDLVIEVSDGKSRATERIEIQRGTKKGLIRTGNLTNADGTVLGNESGRDNVTVGDLDRDGHDDLAIGVAVAGEPKAPRESGEVRIVYGGPKGQSNRPVQVISQDTPGVPDESEEKDYFGRYLSIGDTNGDGYGDLAVATSEEGLNGLPYAGQVTLLPGGPKGVTGAGARVYHQDTEGVPGEVSDRGGFGHFVKLADLNGDGRDDLVTADARFSADALVYVLPADRKTGTITGAGSKALGFKELGVPVWASHGFGASYGG